MEADGRDIREVGRTTCYDLVVGDETYGIAVALHKRPEFKRSPFTIIYDFVGMEPMTRNPAERAMV